MPKFSPEKIALVVFDLDGTLVDAFGDIHAAVNYALAKMERTPLDYATVRGYVGNGVTMLMQRALESEDAALVSRGVELWKEYAAQHPADHARLYRGAIELIDCLKGQGVKCAVLSNKVHPVTVEVLRKLEVETLLDAIQGDQGMYKVKPDPASLLALMEKMNATGGATLVVGDGDPDILAAKAAGAWSCGVSWGLKSTEALSALGADFVVQSFDELREMFTHKTA